MRSSDTSDAPTMMPLPVGLSPGDFVRRVDPWMVGALALLLTLGVATVYSGSGVKAALELGDSSYFVGKHAGSIFFGLLLMLLVARTPLESWSRLAYPILALTFVLLAMAVFSPIGVTVKGASRWLAFGPLRFQPAELAKLAVPLYLAASLAKKREKASTFSIGFLPHVIVVSAMVALLIEQPDLGTSAVIFATLGLTLFVAGTRTAYLVLAVFAALPVVALYVARYPHALRRLQVFLAPEADRFGAGYHIYQSLVAFGSGGPVGMGLGSGTQKLFFLPEPHTDFIYATLGQELGFAGAILTLGAFCVFIGRAMWIANRLPCRFPMFLAFGVAAWLGLQAVLNMGVAVALLPTKGLTLPFVSFGRSSMVISLIGAGILLRASAEEGAHLRGGQVSALPSKSKRGARKK